MAADISGVALIAPILAFLLVFIVVTVVLRITKILGEHIWIQIFVGFLIAVLFVSVAGVKDLVQTIVPWFAVLIIGLVMFLAIIAFIGKDVDFIKKPIAVVFVIVMGIIIIVSAFVVFSDIVVKYVPGPSYGSDADENTLYLFDWLYSPRVYGAILLIIASAIAAWVLTRK